MTCVDLLSDTTYCEQAVQQLDRLLGDMNQFPVKRTQIYGLRQIARQQPGEAQEFANHQRERAEKKEKEDEVDFWTLVANLCRNYNPSSNDTSDWYIEKEGHAHLPVELQNIPAKRKGMTHEERRHRNELNGRQRELLKQWANEHIPAFFERFCTHALYRLGKQKNSEKE